MKRVQKYNTEKDIIRAFTNYCESVGCVKKTSKGCFRCFVSWMMSDYDDSIMPCIYCGAKMKVCKMFDGYVVTCSDCNNQTSVFETEEKAISSYNEIAKAIEASK